MHFVKNALITLLAYHVICLIPAIIWGRKLWRRDWRRPKPEQLCALVLAAAVFSVATIGLYKFTGDYLLDSSHAIAVLKEQGYQKETFLALSIYFVLVNPLLEELFWRGVVLNQIERLKPQNKSLALLWSSFAAALFHYPMLRLILYPPGPEIGVLALTVYGAFLALLYKRTSNITLSIIAHAGLTDLAVIILITALFDRFSLSPF